MKHSSNCCKYEKGVLRHSGCTPEGCANCAVCAEHAIFRQATERRKANNIRMGFFRVKTNADNIISLNEFWKEYVERLGAQKASDYLVVVMRRGFEALRDAMERQAYERTHGKSQRTAKGAMSLGAREHSGGD